MIWYVPSFYGDIRLSQPKGKEGSTSTLISWEKLTPLERKALLLFHKNGWLEEDDVVKDSFEMTIPVDLIVARDMVASVLKPKQEVVHAVTFKDGRIEEHKRPEDAKDAAAGTTIAKPTQGCPEPNLAKAELRAREVLFAFLSEEQQEDFLKYNRFVTVGALTGHSYMITSRHARDGLAMYRRQVFDLEEQRPYCIHDATVPAAEELLAIHLLLSMPQHEGYVRHLE